MLWGLTTYFNPCKYQSRANNYHAFRRGSREQGLPLVTVELCPGEVEPGLKPERDAEILIQRTSSAVMWHKERLLNIALEALPPECEYVCWLDADVVFNEDDWIARCISELEKHPVLQPFEYIIRPRKASSRPSKPRTSLGWSLRAALPISTVTRSFSSRHHPDRERLSGTTGYAWCARRDLLERHGFYDRCIVGGGDRELALAFILPSHEIPEEELSIRHPKLREHIRTWHDGLYADVRGDLSYLPMSLRHLWHGEVKNRGYAQRHAILERHDFDPERDIVLDSQGCWTWAEGTEALAADVKDYFASRREDG